jgi:hypothetical protein
MLSLHSVGLVLVSGDPPGRLPASFADDTTPVLHQIRPGPHPDARAIAMLELYNARIILLLSHFVLLGKNAYGFQANFHLNFPKSAIFGPRL